MAMTDPNERGLVKRWSTKDAEVIKRPSEGAPGEAILRFSDRYSVYDFGPLPDIIPGKGAASCAMAVRSFELLADAGVPTHFVERVSETALRVRFFALPSTAAGPSRNAVVPLQVVYRNALPRESSVHRRLADRQLAPDAVPPVAGDGTDGRLSRCMVEFTTKLEAKDRFITAEEAAAVGKVTPQQLEAIGQLCRRVNDALAAHSDAVGLDLVDGKAEFAVGADGAPLVIDHVGTPDENRFYFRGMPACKELLRFLHPDLRQRVLDLVAAEVPRSRWPAPPRLAQSVIEAMAAVYAALAALWTRGRPRDAEDLAQALNALAAANPPFEALRERTGFASESASAPRVASPSETATEPR